MGWLRNLDLASVIWGVSISMFSGAAFAGLLRGLARVGVEMSDLSVALQSVYFSFLLIGAIGIASAFWRPVLWGLIAFLLLRAAAITWWYSGDPYLGEIVLRGDAELISVRGVWFWSAIICVGSFFLLRWREEKKEYEAEKFYAREFD